MDQKDLNQAKEAAEFILGLPPSPRATPKVYKCSQCGHESVQNTNHRGPTWSWERVNVCPSCPPYKKYAEFGGQTIWQYVRDVEPKVEEETNKCQRT